MASSIPFYSSINSTPSEPIVITRKKGSDTRIRILVLTSNAFKLKEYKEIFEEGYGVNLFHQAPPEAELTDEVVRNILAGLNHAHPHYILREESSLVDASNGKPVDALSAIEGNCSVPMLLKNKTVLRVWKPLWKNEQFTGFETEGYFTSLKGYIDPSLRNLRDPSIFGWDHLFRNAATRRTNWETVDSAWGKNSARQMGLGDFITNNLFYDKAVSFKHHPEYDVSQSIQFTQEGSVENFVYTNKYTSNPNFNYWGLNPIREHVLDLGLFFKYVLSRFSRNFFSPGIGGVPQTPKGTAIEETLFGTHDNLHRAAADFQPDGNFSKEANRVYCAERMLSEACTIIWADMLYADSLAKTNPDWEKDLDKRIYGLFKALDLGDISTLEKRIEAVKKILWANVRYAVLGDDSEFKKLLIPGQEDKLDAYKNHFGKFFVGDHVWANANFNNMAKLKDDYVDWNKRVGKEQFAKAQLPVISDIVEQLRQEGTDLTNFEDIIKHLFDNLIQRLYPKEGMTQMPLSSEQRISNAFRSYMIGQMTFYSRFRDLPGVSTSGDRLMQRLSATDYHDKEARDSMREQFNQDVNYVWGLGALTTAAAINARLVHPPFPPVYIVYAKQTGTIAEKVQEIHGSTKE